MNFICPRLNHPTIIMSDRGLSPFVKAFVYFLRTLKPSRIIGTPRAQFIGSDHLGNKYFEIKNGKF